MTANSWANSVEVVNVDIQAQGNHQYQFAVTLRHEDGGWDHYANRWEILDTEGNIMATRTLYHPHVNEQPFTRSLTATLPESVKTVIIRAHDSVHQYGDKDMKVSLP
ncbi:hypothetical protein [sulfur-oxidizing endosymbiont of Gigantopelta aegis]|uniref:hypothetical protein n=1 Tax=sulfur-oxidizing endosymbiont of Gigantopelta aegis TaxID=2794934 RepID=UPI001FE414FF|nr:hypothetical protein [sulfur-oxidizing endosymbiont of Gigantopelta aegis]